MGHKTGIIVGFSIVLLAGMLTTFSVAFADKIENPLGMVFEFIQNLKYGQSNEKSTIATTEMISATVISQLKNEVSNLEMRVNSLEQPPKIHTTELVPVTDIDCSNRNAVEAFLSGWCPHQTRNIYFIEDNRVSKDSIIAISLVKNSFDIENQSVCGTINQGEFNFSFRDPKTGKVTMLEELHGFIMKCDNLLDYDAAVLKYTIINS
jgi:hypothetical protein